MDLTIKTEKQQNKKVRLLGVLPVTASDDTDNDTYLVTIELGQGKNKTLFLNLELEEAELLNKALKRCIKANKKAKREEEKRRLEFLSNVFDTDEDDQIIDDEENLLGEKDGQQS